MITENGQVGRTELFAILEICCQRVGEAYGKPDSDKWTNSDYVSLGQLLFRHTRVRISPNTLKRIFGKIKTDVRYYPQKATRDALAVYIGYSDWEHFVRLQGWTEHQANPDTSVLLSQQKLAKHPLPGGSKVTSRTATTQRVWPPILIGSAVLLVGLAMLLLKQQVRQSASPRLVCRNPLGENPHTALFQLKGAENLPKSEAYTIQFGDGKQVHINLKDSLYSHYYEQPGRYFAVLQSNGQNIDTTTVYLQTHGWAVTASMMNDSSRVYPIYVNNLFTGSRRSVSATEARQAGIDTNRTFFMEFTNSQPTPIDGDNFELTTQVKTSPDRPGVRCSQVGITVWGVSSQHAFEVMKPGCVHWLFIQNSEIYKKGDHTDLNFMGADLRAGGTLTLRVVNQQASIFINHKKAYEAHYTQPLHHIYGTKIKFAGVGTVDSFSVRDLKTGALFTGNF